MWFKNDDALKYKKVNLKPMTIDSVDPVKEPINFFNFIHVSY